MEKSPSSVDNQDTKSSFISERNYLIIHIISIVVIALAALIFIVPSMESANHAFAIGFVIIVALSFIYGLIARHISPKVKDRNPNFNPYHTFFFKGTVILSVILVIFAILGALFVYIEHDNLFQAVGLATTVIWIALFLIYFMWSVYHYNINYGLTDQDWQRIYDFRDMHSKGIPVKASDLEMPEHNPYKSQTFGLPPGTVRGMIAFTLLMGGMSLLIVSFGTQYSGVDAALLSQQFEFFETAFLMMIAFYFGDKSLKYLRERWVPKQNNTQNGGQVQNNQSLSPSSSQESKAMVPMDSLELDNAYFDNEDRIFSIENGLQPADVPPASQQRSLLSTSFEAQPEISLQREEYVQIKDNTNSKLLSDMDIRIALDELEAKENIKISLPVIKALVKVESAGRGHLSDGRAKILFEGHKFWYWLNAFGKDPEALSVGHEDIIYKKWTRAHYRVGLKEYDRLEEAKKIDPKAAIYSTSWGLFQILGENMEHNIKSRNYKDVAEFEAKQHESEYFHFLDFLAFIKIKKVRGKALIEYISESNEGNYDWESFAYGYNGSGYKVNEYHLKMKHFYEQFKNEQTWKA
ncbi:N-acetylmuramidase family protein [uncultured Cyclobacterium sp.]|uniref:N-acetylmuramidase family protein n=1 Tax=uncultured Cyclobacterium sp. TaxID=453820 RepID=UPI0030EBC314|tara:strand:- start:625 stop:2361 length:1737 start_codon:yes stop_codon:yes gene_type:complete